MKIAVISDSHNNLEYLRKVGELFVKQGISIVVHLGDNYDDAEALSDLGLSVIKVPGVYEDYYKQPEIPNRIIKEFQGVKTLITHTEQSHENDLPSDIKPEQIIAEKSVEAIFYGHTHIPKIEEKEGILFVNPGHLKKEDKKGYPATYAIVEITDVKIKVKITDLIKNEEIENKEFIRKTVSNVKLFLDIETIPGEEKLKEELNEKEYIKTALNGDFGRILCLGYIKEIPGKLVVEGIITGDEKEILIQFWDIAKDVNLFIGHNILDFDMRFIMKRSVIHGVKPTVEINFAKYKNDIIYDTMREWERWSEKKIDLDKLAKVLGLPSSKTELNGSQVYNYYIEGKLEEIYNYCKADVSLVRKIYNKMNFIE